MSRIDPSRQDSMSEPIFRFYHNQQLPKIEFLYEISSKIPRFYQLGRALYIKIVAKAKLRGRSHHLHTP